QAAHALVVTQRLGDFQHLVLVHHLWHDDGRQLHVDDGRQVLPQATLVQGVDAHAHDRVRRAGPGGDPPADVGPGLVQLAVGHGVLEVEDDGVGAPLVGLGEEVGAAAG